MDDFFHKIYYRSVINHACRKLWEGDSTRCMKWMEQIQEAKQMCKISRDLSHKWKLCILVAQLHLYVLHVNRNSAHLWQPDLFMKSFDKVATFFPFSDVEIKCMKAKMEKWFANKTPSMADCVGYINEVKEFFQPLYSKYKEPSLDEWHSTFMQFASGDVEPTSASLKEAFLMSYNGSEEDGLKEWEEIKSGKHKDVAHLEKKLARKREQRQQGEAMKSVLPNELNECEIRLEDIVKSPDHKNRLSSNKTNTGCYQNDDCQNGKEVTDSDIDQEPSDNDDDHEWITENSQTATMSPRCRLAETSIRSPVSNANAETSGDGGEPSFRNAKDNVCIERTSSEDVSTDDDKEVGKNDSDTENIEMEVNTEQVDDGETSDDKEYKTASDGGADDLVESANSVSSNLTKAAETLMHIVKDPYQKGSLSCDDDNLPSGELQRKKQESPKQQDDELVDDDNDDSFCVPQEKIVLKPIKKNKGVLNFVRKDNDKDADDVFFSTGVTDDAPKRKKKRYWSDAEMDWIREGIEKYGVGNWAAIRENYPFVNRRSGDIKDKYRNMVKNAEL